MHSFTHPFRNDACDEICPIDTVSLSNSRPIRELLAGLTIATVPANEDLIISPLSGAEAAYPGVNVDLPLADVFLSEKRTQRHILG